MNDLLHVSSSPHVRSGGRTDTIMFLVLLALMPSSVMGIYIFGVPALKIIILSVGTCVLTEFLYERLMHKPNTIGDGSAMVTGLLLALNLSAAVPWWIPVIGGVFAILIVKQLFGGLGQNFMNPALAARCFLLISFPARMTDFSVSERTAGKVVDTISAATQAVDTVSSATPLAAIRSGGSYDLLSMFLGNTRGTIGETSVLLLLLGGIFLVAVRVIDLRIPFTYLGTFALLYLIFSGFDLPLVAAELCGGGLMLGAWFMATDYVTRPITIKGQYVFGILLGILTAIFRRFGASAEGVSYAIILSNVCVPVIERFTLPSGFGVQKQKGEKVI